MSSGMQRARFLLVRVGVAASLSAVGCSADSAVPVTRDDPVLGQSDALVTVVAFGDYQCPYTARAMTTLEAVRSRYSADEIRIAWKHFPLSFHAMAHSTAESTAAVNIVAGPERFWSLSRQILDSQRELTAAGLEAWVAGLDVPPDQYRELLSTGWASAKVDNDLALASRLGISAAPTFFVNGLELRGAVPDAAMIDTIDRALMQARELVSSGVDRAAVYDMATGLNRSLDASPTGP